MRKTLKGFTMVELLVAMAIIGLLIAAAIWGIGLAQQSARNTQRREAGSQILAGLAEYYSRYNAQATCVAGDRTNLRMIISNSAVGAGCTAAVAATATQRYEVPTRGAAMPLTADSQSKLTNIPNPNYRTDASAGEYIIRTSATSPSVQGYLVCVYLEGSGGGVANLSDPASLVCPQP